MHFRLSLPCRLSQCHELWTPSPQCGRSHLVIWTNSPALLLAFGAANSVHEVQDSPPFGIRICLPEGLVGAPPVDSCWSCLMFLPVLVLVSLFLRCIALQTMSRTTSRHISSIASCRSSLANHVRPTFDPPQFGAPRAVLSAAWDSNLEILYGHQVGTMLARFSPDYQLHTADQFGTNCIARVCMLAIPVPLLSYRIRTKTGPQLVEGLPRPNLQSAPGLTSGSQSDAC